MTATVETRAELTRGISNDDIYRMIERLVVESGGGAETILDVGCGAGLLRPYMASHFRQYSGADIFAYDGFPADCPFHKLDLDSGRVALPDGAVDVVAAVETIEHLENPRALFRELTRLCKPGGRVIVSTPNQLSLLSKLSLLLRNEFTHFRGRSYPAHITALLEIDLRRMAAECGLTDIRVVYSGRGRMPGGEWKYPQWLSRIFPRSLSDNVAIVARKPI